MSDQPPETPSERLRRLSSDDPDAAPTHPKTPRGKDDIPTGPLGRVRRGELPPKPAEPPLSESARHPTGDPDQTAGWYGEDKNPPPDATESASSARTRRAPHIDSNGMPLPPSRVPEKDPGGTQVQRSAWDLGAPLPAAKPAYRPRYPQVPAYVPPPPRQNPPPTAGNYSAAAAPRSIAAPIAG